jgi:HEAT repeat protein
MRIALVVFLLAAWPAYGQSPNIDALLARISAYEHGQSRAALVDFEAALAASHVDPEKLASLERGLVRLLKSNATLAGKDFACRQLSHIGTSASVAVLGGMLLVPETADIARFALERIPAAEAGAALRTALERTSGNVRIGIVNTLGRRRDARAVPALRGLVRPTEPALASAALSALSEIGGREAMLGISGARKKLSGELRQQASEAYLRCATSAGGQRAAAVYRELLGPGEPEMVRVAALLGLARTAPREALPTLRQAIGSEGRFQTAAIAALGEMRGPEGAEILREAFPKAAPGAQVRILAALSARPDATAHARLFSDAAGSESPEVRVAAVHALGTCGDATAVELLAASAAKAGGAEQSAARESLYRLRGADVDAAVLKSLAAAAEPALHVELIRAASARGMADATGALLKSARSSDREVRREAIRALRDTASAQHTSALIALLAETASASDRVEIERTAAYVLKRSDPAPVGSVLTAYETAGAPVRMSLLQILGQTGNPEALPLLRTSLNATDPQIARAAILALSEWPSSEPGADLLALAKDAPVPAHRVLALRGYIKIATATAGRPAKETAALLAEAMRLATQPDEKRAVLAALPRYPCDESLAVAETALKDESVAAEARTAADRIKRALAPRQQ